MTTGPTPCNCGLHSGPCPTPQACLLPIADATRPPRVAFLLADAFDNHPNLTAAIALVALLVLLGITGRLDELAYESIEVLVGIEETQP